MNCSITAPVLNTNPSLLRAAARSVLADHTGLLTPVHFVDHASSDPATCRTLAALARADGRALRLRNPTNPGPATSRNHGSRAATAARVGFLDADDRGPPRQIAHLPALQAAHPEARWQAMGMSALPPTTARWPARATARRRNARPRLGCLAAKSFSRHAPGGMAGFRLDGSDQCATAGDADRLGARATVPAVPPPHIPPMADLPQARLIKIDVEGEERLVTQGMTEALAPNCEIALNPAALRQSSGSHAIFAQAGFAPFEMLYRHDAGFCMAPLVNPAMMAELKMADPLFRRP